MKKQKKTKPYFFTLKFNDLYLWACFMSSKGCQVITHTDTYPVSGMTSHCYGNPGILADGSFVSDCRCWPYLHLRGFTERKKSRDQ